MSPADLPEYLRADYEALPERRRAAYLEAMIECLAVAEGRAVRVPTDPARRRVLAEAMAEADAIAAWLAEAPFPGPMPPSSPRARRPYRPISDRDMSRSGAVG